MTKQNVQLGTWVQTDYISEPERDALLSVLTAMPSGTAAALMALDAWDERSPSMETVYEAVFGRRPSDDVDAPDAMIAAWASGSLAANHPDHALYRVSAETAARVLSVLGGLDIADIMAARRLAREQLAMMDEAAV